MIRDDILMDEEPIIYTGGRLEISDEGSQHDKNNLIVPWEGEDHKSFFSGRNGLLEEAIDEIKQFFAIEENELVGIWLLTEITFWDSEKERVVLVTKQELIVVKYDFIALKLLSHYKVLLKDIDTVVIGDLVYPSNSLAPHLIGFTTGIARVFKNSTEKITSDRTKSECVSGEVAIFEGSYFRPRSRNMVGIRLMWNKGEPPRFVSKWNPFSNAIPWSTFVSHPLLWHKDSCEEEQRIYNVECFASRIVKAAHQADRTSMCNISQQSILLQNYFGILSILHNRTSLGFFKVRGKLSF